MSLNCANCNAPLSGHICDYCGTKAGDSQIETEKKKLASFHQCVKDSDPEKRHESLAHGYMPESPEVLLEAGFNMVPLIKSDELSYDNTKAAVARLQAIVTRLKSAEQTDAIAKAIVEFDEVIARYEREDRILGISCLGAIAVAIAGAIWLWVQ